MDDVCKRPSCGKRRYPGRKWCSSECAVRSGAVVSPKKPVTPSMSAAGSSTKERGADLPPRSLARSSDLSGIASAGGLTRSFEQERQVTRALAAPDRMHESATPIERSAPASEPPSIASETSEECEIQDAAIDSELNTTPVEESDLSTSRNIATRETPHENSIGQYLTPEEEKLASTSLCDEVIERLSWQLRRHTLRGEQKADLKMIGKEEIDRSKIVIGTVAQIASMIRLKLEAVRTFRDIEN